jgi:hypothetical protein
MYARNEILIRILIVALAALTLTCGSFRYQRRGPELVVVGNLCGPKMDEFCYSPVLKGGFPLAYIYDSPGVSVEGKLSLGEDKFRGGRFVLDVLIYFALGLAVLSANHRLGGSSPSSRAL